MLGKPAPSGGGSNERKGNKKKLIVQDKLTLPPGKPRGSVNLLYLYISLFTCFIQSSIPLYSGSHSSGRARMPAPVII